jgi:hypothetical protein
MTSLNCFRRFSLLPSDPLGTFISLHSYVIKLKKEISEKNSARVFVTNVVSMYIKNHILITTSHNQNNLALRILHDNKQLLLNTILRLQ